MNEVSVRYLNIGLSSSSSSLVSLKKRGKEDMAVLLATFIFLFTFEQIWRKHTFSSSQVEMQPCYDGFTRAYW